MAIELDASASRADSADGRIPVALSSETPVDRYFGREILDHSASAVDLSRAANGLPLLDNHDAYTSVRSQIGLIEDVQIGADRKIRGMLRFSERAQDIRADVEAGIIRNVSIGYRIDELKLETSDKKAGDTYRATRWTLLEGSLVSVPADATVGVGRSADATTYPVRLRAPEGETMKDKSRKQRAEEEEEEQRSACECSEEQIAAGECECAEGRSEEDEDERSEEEEEERSVSGRRPRQQVNTRSHSTPRKGRSPIMSVQDNSAPNGATRAADLSAIATEYQASDKLARWITEGTTPEAALREIASRTSAPAPVGVADVTLTPKEQRQFSVVRALNALVNGRRDGFEFEVSDAIAKQHGRSTEGIYIPTSIAAQNPAMAPDTRTQLSLAAGAGKGTETKFTEFGSFIDLLRNRMVTTTMGAQYLSGLQGDVAFPNQSAAGTFSWGTEVANASLTSLTTASRTMSPKVGQSASSVSRQLLRQSIVDVENLVRNDIAAIHAIGIDLAAIHGTGAANQPRGVTNVVGIGSVVGGVNGLAPTYDHMVDLQKEVAVDNALAGSLGYVVHPLIAARLMKTQQFSSTNGTAVWTGNILDGQVAGFKAIASNQVVSGVTKGTSTDCSTIIFGDWSSLIIGEWGSFELLVDPYTLGPTLVKLASIQMIDVLLRYPEKFAVMADARI